MRAALHPNTIAFTRRRLGDRWMLFLAISLLGYALVGRGYAYAGYPPIFISEVLLAVGLTAFLMTAGWLRVMRMPPAVAALPLVLLGFFRLLPGLPQYGLEAARDAVVWAYAAFALVVASLIVSQPDRLRTLME